MDLRDLEYYGRKLSDFKVVTTQELRNLKNEAQNWMNSSRGINPKTKKKPKGLRRWNGTRFVNHNGNILVLYKKGLNVETMSFQKYMSNLTRASGIPKGIFSQLQSDSASLLNEIDPDLGGKYPEGFDGVFKNWFKKYVVGQKTEQQFWRNLGQLYVESGLEKDKFRQFPEMDRSHFFPRSKGGDPFTFLENWLVNQSRGATEFTSRENLRKLGIPTNWNELIDAVHRQEVLGELTPLGVQLQDIGGYEASALMRGIEPEQIITWRNRISEIQDEAIANPSRIPELQPEYTNTILDYRGPGNEIGAKGLLKMKDDIKNNVPVDFDNYENFISRYSETDLAEDIDLINKTTNRPNIDNPRGGGGGSPETKFSFEPPTLSGKQASGLLGTGLTIGGITKGLASEVPFSTLNPETAQNVGEGLKTYQDTGEVSMDNVRGAAAGIGKDLAFSAVTGTGLRSAFKAAATRGATHFGGKALLGKAVPYVGWGLLAYGVYDTADAFTKGYTGKGITERIQEVDYGSIIEDVFSSENSPFKRKKDDNIDIPMTNVGL